MGRGVVGVVGSWGGGVQGPQDKSSEPSVPAAAARRVSHPQERVGCAADPAGAGGRGQAPLESSPTF